MRTVLTRLGAILGVAMLLLVVVSPPSSAAPAHSRIQGTGSSWSAVAVKQWIADVDSSGIQVDFTGSGSAQGRKDFANRVTDYAVTDIGFQGRPGTNDDDTNCLAGQGCRDFAYEPIVAGGTSFPYQLRVAGQLVRNLRLSGQTIAKIFTKKITNWNDPQIASDNNGRKFPSLPIIPVTHAEGSGSTAQFTTYLDNQYPGLWRPFSGINGFTEFWPSPRNGGWIAQSGSDGVMNFVSSGAANGAIGYDEYAYPLAKNFPVAKMLNKAGYYTLPDQYNVAVALQHAQINLNKSSPDYLLQDLKQVYVAPEKPAYPLSSYSYFIIPTGKSDTKMTTAKRQTLADYLYYSVCQGQKEMGPIGYSPLPINLVQASFDQTAKLKAADPNVVLDGRGVSTCQNPTFVAGQPKVNRLAQIAPIPAACDKQGAGPCTTDGAGAPTRSSSGGGNSGSGSGSGGGSGSTGGTRSSGGGTSTGGTVSATGGSAAGGGTATGNGVAGGATKIDPDTGQVVSASGDGTSDGSGAQAVPAELSAYRQTDMTSVLAPLAVLEILAVIVLPPVVYLILRRRRASS